MDVPMDVPLRVSRTVILIDPSSPHGEGGLGLLTDRDRAVTLLLTLDGRSSRSLRDFAEAEDIDVSMAGLIYLDQVAERLSTHTDDIETVSTSGSDAVSEIFRVMQQHSVERVIVPASLPGLDDKGLAVLLHACPVPVVIAPRGDAEPIGPDHSGEWQTASTLLPSGSRTNAP